MILSVMLVVGLVLAGTSGAAIDKKSVVGVWLFDDGLGTTAVDSSGNGYDGTIKGGAKWVPGKFGGALEFNGKDAYVATGEQLLEKVEEFTIVLWVNKGKITSDRVGLIGQNDTVEMGFISPTSVQIWSEGAGTGPSVDYPFGEGEWHHLAATGSATSVKNYLDGELGQEAAVAVANHGSSAFEVNIGGGGVFDADGNWYTGDIDDVAIFNVALEQDDIKKIMDDGLALVLGLAPVSAEGKLAGSWGELKTAP